MNNEQMISALALEVCEDSRIEVFPVNAQGQRLGPSLFFRSMLKAAAYVDQMNKHFSPGLPEGFVQ